MEPINLDDIKHIFISGPPRSGTTLIRLILSNHSQITITPEAHFPRLLIKKGYTSSRNLSSQEKNQLLEMLARDIKINRWPNFEVQDFIDRVSRIEPLSIPGLLDQLFLEYARAINSGTVYLGNKKGLYTQGFAPDFKRLFTDAKFIIIVRDARDIVRSVIKNFQGFDIASAVKYCSHRSIYIQKMMKRYPDDVYLIRYEDLVQDSHHIVSAMCDWLQLPYQEEMFSYYESNAHYGLVLEETTILHKHTADPPKPELINQWKKNKTFTDNELRYIETVAYDYFRNYGYDFETSPGSLQVNAVRLKTMLAIWLQRMMILAKKCYHLIRRKITYGSL